MKGGGQDPECVVWDWRQCRCRIEGADFDRVIGMEISGVYDGILFWRCSACGRSFQRWPEDHGLHAKAQPFIDTWNETDEHEARFIGPGIFIGGLSDLNDFAEYGDKAGDETLGDAIRRLAYEELLPDEDDENEDNAEDGNDL